MQDRIKAVRKSQNMTQTDFGAKIGVRGNTITTYETGVRVPSDAVILAICREFGVNETWLRTGAGEMFEKKTRNEELAQFFGEVLSAKEDAAIKQALLTILARLGPDEWKMIEQKALELVDEIKKAGP